jgi:hypothetical protein
MKHNKILILSVGIVFASNIAAQQLPTNNNPSAPANGQNDPKFWSRGGNTVGGGSNNLFGTLWNSPIYTTTNGVLREKLNGDLGIAGAPQYSINGYTAGC